MTKQNRSKLVSFLGAGFAAVIAEHLLRPYLKKALKT